ncbi:hypothetical protein DM02DRAFT_532040 [Periconia macrospinosa]|uniref:DUF1365-domain-containing protein n=1 Tax=Periconia macrospinosa TaxID=97972 RepID=A0A2V1DJH0_9PLEO|nr:hypothetical protein DM02DRAFT_532040 [Periconia macrospinosa]
MEGVSKSDLDYPQPLIFPSRTTHTRLFPQKHSFGYNYLLCGYPIVPTGTTVEGEDISDGKDRDIGFQWLRVRAKDYLKRGQDSLGFYAKLQSFLREKQGVEDVEWSYAYLVTAPRILRYAFNPVSFWYIYNSNHDLIKMILEVNNTFEERHIYLLDGDDPSISLDSTKAKFTDVWRKDFHVSPFNSRKGSYALKALNPFPSPSCEDPKVDNTITLNSSKNHAKIVARVYTTGKPLSVRNMNTVDIVRFASKWWWIGLATFPRIIKEAFKLYFRRGLHVWFRPEVVETSIGRTPTAIERALERVFRDYLDHLVQNSPKPIEVHYEPAIPNKSAMMAVTTQRPGQSIELLRLHVRILTPAFYSRLVHYAYTAEAFDREHTFTDEKNRTVSVSRPELLVGLLPKRSSTKDPHGGKLDIMGYVDELRWALLRKLRCPPPDPAYPLAPKSSNSTIDDIRTLPYSGMDRFVRDGKECAGAYRRMVTKVFLAQLFFLGYTEIVDLIDFVTRFALCWFGYRSLVVWELDCERQGNSCTGQMAASIRVLVICACHTYGLLKGYR